jgi:hypothetical protein
MSPPASVRSIAALSYMKNVWRCALHYVQATTKPVASQRSKQRPDAVASDRLGHYLQGMRMKNAIPVYMKAM